MSTTSSLLYGKKLKSGEAAELLGISEPTLRYWRHVGSGPRSINVGGAVRYLESDLEEWLEAQNAGESA